MLARCVLGLLLLQAAVLGFEGFEFTCEDGTVYCVDGVEDEDRAELEANGCDVDCVETCWHLADGDTFKSCVDFCGCAELITEKEEETPSEQSDSSKKEHLERSEAPKDPEDEEVLRSKQNRALETATHMQVGKHQSAIQAHDAWNNEIPAHKTWKVILRDSYNLRSSKPEEPEAEATAAYDDCSSECSYICSKSAENCLDKCKASFCVSGGWSIWEYLASMVFLGAAAMGISLILNQLKPKKKTGYLLEDSTHRQ